MKKLTCLAVIAAEALTLHAAESILRENFERRAWPVDPSWTGETVLSDEKPRSGKKAMRLSAVGDAGKCGVSKIDYLLGKYEYSLYACGSGEIQLGVIRYDKTEEGKLQYKEEKSPAVPLTGEYRKIVFPFEIRKPNPARIKLTIRIIGKDSSAWIDDLQLDRTERAEADFSDLKSAPQMQAAAAKIKASGPVNILYIGDSLTDLWRGGNHLDMMNYFLGKSQSGVTFHNYACRGDSIVRVMDRFHQAPKVPFRQHYKGIWDRKYAAAFVFLGANDSVQRLETGKMAVPPETAEQKYRELFELFREHGIEKVFLVSPASSYYPACQANAKKRIEAQKGGVFGIPENIESFAAVVRKLADEYHFPYLDLYSAMKDLPDKAKLFNAADGVHLTPDGQEFVALKELEFLAGTGLDGQH